jgi:hypothetical protein
LLFRNLVRARFSPVKADAATYSDFPVPPLPDQKEGADA